MTSNTEPVTSCPGCPEGWRPLDKAHCAKCYEGQIERLRGALEPFATFAEALNEGVPDGIAIGIYADGAMRFGPSGANVGDLRRAREVLNGDVGGPV